MNVLNGQVPKSERRQGEVSGGSSSCRPAPPSSDVLFYYLHSKKHRMEQQVPWLNSQNVTGLCCRGHLVSLRPTGETFTIRATAHTHRLAIYTCRLTITLNTITIGLSYIATSRTKKHVKTNGLTHLVQPGVNYFFPTTHKKT